MCIVVVWREEESPNAAPGTAALHTAGSFRVPSSLFDTCGWYPKRFRCPLGTSVDGKKCWVLPFSVCVANASKQLSAGYCTLCDRWTTGTPSWFGASVPHALDHYSSLSVVGSSSSSCNDGYWPTYGGATTCDWVKVWTISVRGSNWYRFKLLAHKTSKATDQIVRLEPRDHGPTFQSKRLHCKSCSRAAIVET
jgi:hypothetical protein